LRKKHSEMDETTKVSQSPPSLPGYTPQPLGIRPFSDENSPHSASKDYLNGTSPPPVPPLPSNLEREVVDPYARTESMTHREYIRKPPMNIPF